MGRGNGREGGLPFHVRLGVLRCPVEPSERCDLELPCVRDCPLKPQRFIAPANPLPMLVPVTYPGPTP